MTGTEKTGSVGVRHTRQLASIRKIVNTLDQFRTAQDVYDELRTQGETIGLATVYRRLQDMAENGEVDAIRRPDGQWAYRRCSPAHHHHLICRECSKTLEVSIPEEWLSALTNQYGFTDIQHELEFLGRCAECTLTSP